MTPRARAIHLMTGLVLWMLCCAATPLPQGVEKSGVLLNLMICDGDGGQGCAIIRLFDDRILQLNYYQGASCCATLGTREYARLLRLLRSRRFVDAAREAPGVGGGDPRARFLHMKVTLDGSRLEYGVVTDSTSLSTELGRGLAEIDALLVQTFGTAYRQRMIQAAP